MVTIATKIDRSTVVAGDHDGYGHPTKFARRGVLDGDTGITIVWSVRVGRDLRLRKSATSRGTKAGECETRTHDLHELTAVLTLEVLRALLELTIGK